MITMDNFHKARALWQLGKSKSEIAAEIGLNRKTVRKYLDSATPPQYAARQSPSRVDPFAAFAELAREAIRRAPELSAGEVYALIRPRGYQGSERTVERRLRQWREEKPKE